MPNDPINRRNFFRRGLRELLRPMADALEAKTNELAAHLKPLQGTTPRIVKSLTLLRPPGAMGEDDFTNVCSRCGNCVKVCPSEAIRMDPDGLIGFGAPFINANVSPCIVCNGLECMTNCPSGALIATRIADIDMGTARWDANTCLRTRPDAGASQSCQVCVDECPIGEVAIKLDGRKIQVIDNGCIGCGICQHRCPTSPKSIVVEPKERVRDRTATM